VMPLTFTTNNNNKLRHLLSTVD